MDKVTVDLSQPSPYHSPQDGAVRRIFYRVRLACSYRYYKRILSRYAGMDSLSTASILEVGCGSGHLVSTIGEWFPAAETLGLDYDSRLLNEAIECNAELCLIRGTAERLPFSSVKLDVLIGLHVIEHLFRPQRMVEEASRVLKSDGIFVFATPNPVGVGAQCMGDRWSGWREDHVSIKSPEEWRRLLRTFRFTLLEERTTFLTGIPAFRKFPLAVLNWGVLSIFGSLPWKYGEAYISVWRKT